MKSTSPLLPILACLPPGDIGAIRGRTGLAASGREETDFCLFLSQVVRRIRQADFVRRLQELQGYAHLTLKKNLCLEVVISSARVWWIPLQQFFRKKSAMESRA
jgi:hypothetical protein